MTENIVGSSGDQEVATSEARTPASEPSRLNSDGVESTQADESAVIDATVHQLSGCGEGSGPCPEGSPLRILIKTMTHSDMRVRCCSNCLVKKLKCHISKGFPTHPRIEDQKLISSGMLLRDEMTIKSALRIHLTPNKPVDEDYIIHLVCNVKGSSVFKRQQSPNINNSSSSSDNNSTSNSNNNLLTSSTTEGAEASRSSGDTATETGTPSTSTSATRTLHQRLADLSTDQYAKMVADMHKQHQEYFESIKGEMRKCYDDSKPQTEHLMKQLFRRMTAASVDEATSSSSRSNEEEEDAISQSRSPESGGGHDENNNSRDATEVAAQNGGPQEQPEVAPQQQQPQQPAPQRMPQQILNAMGFGAAMGAAPAEEDGEENDWLSWLYAATKLYLLGMILYFYSSLPRFIAVALITLLVVFFQRRWLPVFGQELMRRNRVDAPPRNEEPANQRQEQGANQNEANGGEQPAEDDPAGETGDPTNDNGQSNTENTADTNRRPEAEETRVISRMETVFVAITTFFMSLFPFELLRQE